MNAALPLTSLLVLSLAFAGCGGQPAPVAAAPDASAPPPDEAAPGAVSVPAPAASGSAGPAARPFAASPIEATQLIGAAIDARAAAVRKCVTEYRARKKLPHQRVEISVGIDQEGRMIGASLKGKQQDAPFSACIQQALEGAPFPRSRAGVISVTKSYEEIEQ